jgi:hypothetical protein
MAYCMMFGATAMSSTFAIINTDTNVPVSTRKINYVGHGEG